MTKLKTANYIYLTPGIVFTIMLTMLLTIPIESAHAVTSPQLNVTKIVINDNGGSAVPFNFTMIVNGTNVNPSSFPGNSFGTIVTLDAGTYNVTEIGLAGYSAIFSADCSGTINDNETKTCIVTNDDIQPRLTVIKNVINDNGGTAVPSDFTISVTGTDVSPSSFSGSSSGTLVTLDAGSYNVTETGPSGYTGSFSADCSGTISLGESKTCTITNDDVAQQTETLSAEKDSFLRNNKANRNEGINEILVVKSNYRPVIAFNQTEIENTIGGLDLQSATLRLYVEDNANNWGTSGRTIDIHNVTDSWVEGNGWNFGNNIKGTGSGVTWNCAIDTNINNNKVDCNPKWIGGNFGGVTDSILITNGLVNQFIEFDVTADVQAFLDGTAQNNGWIVKKTSEGQNGRIDFTSDEGSANNPELVLVFS